MEPDITDLDTIQSDDIAGVESIYGHPAPVHPVIVAGLSTGGVVGEEFGYVIFATNQPTSYQASGLPAGLSLNTATGLISGTLTVAGTYDIVVDATNSAGTGTATLHLVFSGTIKITGDLNLSAYVGRPYYYQVATTGQPTGFQPLDGPIPAGLSLDQYTGLISGKPNAADLAPVLRTSECTTAEHNRYSLTMSLDQSTLSALIREAGPTRVHGPAPLAPGRDLLRVRPVYGRRLDDHPALGQQRGRFPTHDQGHGCRQPQVLLLGHGGVGVRDRPGRVTSTPPTLCSTLHAGPGPLTTVKRCWAAMVEGPAPTRPRRVLRRRASAGASDALRVDQRLRRGNGPGNVLRSTTESVQGRGGVRQAPRVTCPANNAHFLRC